MAGPETLLTRLEVTPKGELFAGFRNLGGIHYPNWKHLFVTHILGRYSSGSEEIRDLQAEIASNPKLNSFETRLKSKYWKVFQLFCPIPLKTELPEDFILGHYTQQARWRLTNPGNCISLDGQTQKALEEGREIREAIEYMRGKIEYGRKPAHATRTFNDLDGLFDSYNGANFQEVMQKRDSFSSLRNIDAEIIEQRKKIADKIQAANSSLKGIKIEYSASGSKKEHELRINQDSWKYLEKGRMMTAQELLAKKWLFLDIEIPFFRRENPKISWVGLNYCENGSETKEIHTIHNISAEEVNGFKIRHHRDESELISKLTESVNEQNPDIVSSYNARFDFIKLRESEEGFPIGSEQTNPMFKVTTKFFERIGVKDRFVIDFLRWQKIARAYEINSKLETAAGFRKEIDYDEMEALEDICMQSGEKAEEAGRKIAGYLGEDVNQLAGLFKSEEFRKDLEHVCWICSNYNVGLERVLHSPNCINDSQEKTYFTAVGLYREEVPPHQKTKRMQAIRTKARETFKKSAFKLISQEEREGLFKDVCKVYVPTGSFIKEAVARKFPAVLELDAHKEQFKDDKKRLFFIEQYQEEFCRWLIEDYGLYLGEVNAFDKLTDKLNQTKFEDAYRKFRQNLEENSPANLKRLNLGHISAAAVESYAPQELKEFLSEQGMDCKTFQKIANQRSVIKRRGRNLIGNYDVFPSRRFFVPEKRRKPEDILVVDEVLSYRFGELNDFLDKNGLSLISQEGDYLYLAGKTEALERKDAPVILVDRIPRLYNADNAYYEKFGFFSHIKLKDEPDYHLNVFEMNSYGEILRNLLDENNKNARQIYSDSLANLASGNIPMRDLVFFNKSNERYTAYVTGRDGDGKMHFTSHNPQEQELKTEDSTGLQYFTDISRGKEINVYLAEPERFEPDIEKYAKRFTKRSKALLKPVGGLPGN